ncbi:ECM29 family proteasome component [Aspergillus homomorphus CBS 101889]|uniref:Proteasome component n=1 Tax=Aspergillus homomorphus (strain CBS 101889) TaxID=1450537 RepID=A0A395HLE2_ASPHC|nr:proteasome component [Aspergillus homomorphus CBS 101889]RAL08677.1 proteasome component [Aspergillus homomorphus CBS 101889]
MASATDSPVSSEARELSLISKVELRIALADSDDKLEALLNTYLTPLLLKLGSESIAVRNKVISVCQHINTRVQNPTIKLPVAALLKQFKEQKSQLIRHFDLLYVQQGLHRLGSSARVEILLPLLQGISEIGTSSNQAATVFNLVLRLFPLMNLPPKDSDEDLKLKSQLGLSDQDTKFLSSLFGKLLILSPADKDRATCPGLSPAEYAFLNKDAPITGTWNASLDGGLNLTETKVNALRFLASGAFDNAERFLPAVVASADANSRLSDVGEEILKRFVPSLEDPDVVRQLYDLYLGTGTPDGAPPARPALQTRLLVFLGRSIRATRDAERVMRVIEESLLSDSARSVQGLQASKLRTQLFNFMTWVVRMGSPDDLQHMAPKLIAGLMDFIQSQGWPSPAASGQRPPQTELSLRGMAYECIGILVPKADFRSQKAEDAVSGFQLIKWLFMSLSSDDSSAQIFVSIEQALGSILSSSMNDCDHDFQAQLRPFLLQQMNNQPGQEDPLTGLTVVRNPQYAAVRFANRFLPYSDVVARWIDLMAVAHGSERHHEVVEEGKKGLHPYWFRLQNANNDHNVPSKELSSWYSFPGFTDAVRFLLNSTVSQGVVGSSAEEILSGNYRNAFPSAIEFLRNILFWESITASGTQFEIEHDWDVKLDVMLSSEEQARDALRGYLRSTDEDAIAMFLSGALAGLSRESQTGRQQCGRLFLSICSLAPNGIVEKVVPQTLALKTPLSSNDQETQDVSARAIGIIASHPALLNMDMDALATELLNSISTWKVAIGEVALRVRGAVMALSYLLSRLAFRKMISRLPEAYVRQFIDILCDMIENARDSLICRAAQAAIGRLGLSDLLSYSRLSESNWSMIRKHLIQDAKAENEVAIMAIGLLSMTFSRADSADVRSAELTQALYDLHENRNPELHFTVGEALSNAAVGWSSKSLALEFDVDEAVPVSEIPGSVLAEVCDKVLSDCGASKPSLKKAAAIWLLSLVKNCGHLLEVKSRLVQFQRCFSSLLSDREEVVQETGAQGLSLVYEQGDQELKDDLVRDLINSFTEGHSNLGGGRVNRDTELFEPGALPTGGGSSVNTYKDIMNLAAEAGDPTLVYRFMSLASNNALWTSRAAFSKLGISSIFSDSSVDGYLSRNPKIYPKLFRYRFDPNPNVQRSMNTIWRALVKNPTEVIDAHLDEIMVDLLKSMLSGREWRARQASCAAIADLIQGRQPEMYAGYMNEIFTKAFKLLDDIKETVRVSAMKLCQTITNAIIRTLETSKSDAKQAGSMLESVIPFLLSDKGVESGVGEVQGFAIGALIQMIKKCPSKPLRPFVPHMIEQFLSSLSSLEPQAVNYVHLNADKYGLTGQDIDKMRLSSIRTSPMMEVIERYLIDMLDEEGMKEFASRLEGVLRSAVGLPSKVGCSRVLVLLSMRTTLLRPFADRFIQLLGKYVVDRNDTVSASYCSSIGYLMRLASDEQFLKTVEHAKKLYLTAEDTNQRVISAEILLSTSKLASDRFAAFASAALPFIFVSRYDLDEHVREVFEKTWQDNVGGNRAVSLYIKEIVDFVSTNLESARWAIKHTAALGLANAVTSLDAEIDLATSEYIWPVLERALAGKTWDGKEVVLKAFAKFAKQAKRLWEAKPQLADSMKAITIREARRNNVIYRPHALIVLGQVSQAREDLDLMPDVISVVTRVLDQLEEDGDPMEVDSESGPKPTQILDDTLAACAECLLHCLRPVPHRPASAVQEHLEGVMPGLRRAMSRGGRNVQTTLYRELCAVFDQLGTWIGGQGGEVDQRGVQEALAALANEMLSRDIDTSVEKVRLGRAQASASYVKLCEQMSCPIEETLWETIRTWRKEERSGMVRQVLDRIL